jgi:hypothetical protein
LKLAELYDRNGPTLSAAGAASMRSASTPAFARMSLQLVRSRHNAYAVDGRDGWNKPALGTPSLVDIDLNGRKIGSRKSGRSARGRSRGIGTRICAARAANPPSRGRSARLLPFRHVARRELF